VLPPGLVDADAPEQCLNHHIGGLRGAELFWSFGRLAVCSCRESVGDVGARGAVTGEVLVITNDSYTYSIKILRQEKIIRDHDTGPRHPL
jgi:hypothetical protein